MKPDHYSHSQINSWLRCGKAYQLDRLIDVPQRPAVYLVVGNAMHTAIESLNRSAFEAQERRVGLERKMPTNTVGT